MKKVIYVSGPMRAPTLWQVRKNCMRIIETGWELIKRGWCVIVPVWFGDFLTDEDWKNIDHWEEVIVGSDCEIVKRCDTIFMCKGWEKSSGANKELETAKEYELEIIYEEDKR
jgi:hypothetical protein